MREKSFMDERGEVFWRTETERKVAISRKKERTEKGWGRLSGALCGEVESEMESGENGEGKEGEGEEESGGGVIGDGDGVEE